MPRVRYPGRQILGRREAPIFENGHLKSAVGPIRPWALANLVMALGKITLTDFNFAVLASCCAASFCRSSSDLTDFIAVLFSRRPLPIVSSAPAAEVVSWILFLRTKPFVNKIYHTKLAFY